MLGASFLPARFRSDHGQQAGTSNPGYINRWITPYLQSVSRRAFTHPIHTIVFVALLASTSYVGILEGSLLDHTSVAGNLATGANLTSLAEGGRRLNLGKETSWRWQTESRDTIVVDTVRPKAMQGLERSTDPGTGFSALGPLDPGISRLLVERLSSDSPTARQGTHAK